jgi:threonine aldolase
VIQSLVREQNLWINLAQHANDMAQRLYRATREIDGVTFPHAPAINGLFPILPAASIAPLAQWCHFWPWDESIRQVRWMTAWDTTPADVNQFAAGIQATLATP